MRGGVRGVVIYGILIVVGVISSIPLYWMVITSLKVAGKEFLFPPEWFPNPQVWSKLCGCLEHHSIHPAIHVQQLLYFDPCDRRKRC